MRCKSVRIFLNLLAALAVVLASAVAQAQSLPSPNPAATVKVMVFGDSLVAGYGLALADSFPAQLEARLRADGRDISVINAGVSGDTTSSGLTRLDWALTQKPDFFILVLGGNDMLRQVDLAVTRANLDKIVGKVHALGIPVLIAGMRPYRNFAGLGGGGLEGVYEDIADKYDALLYPFFLKGVELDAKYNLDDGIHPNKQGVALIVEGIYDDVKELLSE